MDFFETQERYRRREMRGWLALLFRVAIVGGTLWFGWVWGKAHRCHWQVLQTRIVFEYTNVVAETKGIYSREAKHGASNLIPARPKTAFNTRARQIVGGISPKTGSRKE